ncbi:MAG TPA: MFS transporter [Gemmatimonadales bacterium]|nr:MFS transporter [Gemmatimonadales bacterium]
MKRILAWCLFDWANSPYTTLVVTFVYSTYFAKAFAPDVITGTAWWSRAVSIAGLTVALIAPALGALADRAGLRLRFLAAATATCALASAALAFIAPGGTSAALLALGLFVLADIGFELGMQFYNALLPTVAPAPQIGRVSGYGWALGYAGGLVALLLALIGFVQTETPWFGVVRTGGANIRATCLLVAVWLVVFALPLFLTLREERRPGVRLDVVGAFRELGATFRGVRRYRDAALFLLARLLFNDGLITVFAFGGIYAAGTFGMTLGEVIKFGIGINVAAGAGAFLFGYVDDRIGGRRTVLISCAALAAATALAVWAPTRTWFWIAGMAIGVFAGPNQAASRSLMARFAPPGRENEFFGFFAFSGRLTSFAGPALLGIATQTFGSQRAGVATILLFLLVGGGLLLLVDEGRGRRAALTPASPPG